MNFEKSVQVLRDHFGSHGKTAKALGLSSRSYTQHRTSYVPVRVQRYIRLVAFVVQSGQDVDDLEFLNPGPSHSPVDGTKKGDVRGLHDRLGEPTKKTLTC